MSTPLVLTLLHSVSIRVFPGLKVGGYKTKPIKIFRVNTSGFCTHPFHLFRVSPYSSGSQVGETGA